MKPQLIIGILLLLGSIWGGSYLLDQFGFGEWQHFPIAATAFLVGAVGFFLCVFSIITGVDVSRMKEK